MNSVISLRTPQYRVHPLFLLITTFLSACASAPAKPNPPGQTPTSTIAAVDKKSSPTVQGLAGFPPSPSPTSPLKKTKFSLYAMSKCPFAGQAEEALHQAFLELQDYVDFKIHFIVREQDGRFMALHGESEVRANILQLCVQHQYSIRQTLAFMLCQNETLETMPAGWEKCARRAGLNEAKIQSCADSGLGEQLLRASMNASNKAQAVGSPTIDINGSRYQGDRSKLGFMRGLCTAMKEKPPAPCLTIPKLAVVDLTILSDKRCDECQTEEMANTLRERFFPSLKVHKVDYDSPEGRKLYQESGEKFLPLFLFQENVKKADTYDSISRWMIPRGGYLALQVPARFDPLAEICDNNKDDTGNKLIDCADPSCQVQLICRKEIFHQLDVFVMSQCPYAAQALLAVQEVLDNFKGKAHLKIHYIAEQGPDGSFQALHGPSEVAENIRQLCAKKYYPNNNMYLKYIWCRSKNYSSSDWTSCANSGISAKIIEKCATGRMGQDLLAQDLKLAKELNISGSPTWLANNRYPFNGITAEQIKTEFCNHNKKLKECSNKLRETPMDTALPAGSCGN